jgi:transposase-like protein
MAQVYLREGEQARFLQDAKDATGLTWKRIAEICGIERHTLRAWRDEAWHMSHSALLDLSYRSGVPVPPIVEIVPEEERRRRSAVKGAHARAAIHGPVGTPEGRGKGGQVTQRRRRENPELYEGKFSTRKPIRIPPRSPRLAELVGIILGDGQISDLQVVVSNHAEHERQYSAFVAQLFYDLFALEASLDLRPKNTLNVVVSSIALVEHLETLGLYRGSKVSRQVGIPEWIFEDGEYICACIRGLVDTDGSVFLHRQRYKQREYRFLELYFSNHSQPLLAGMERLLSCLQYIPKRDNRGVTLYRQEEVKRYFETVSTHNPYHRGRYARFTKEATAAAFRTGL